MDAPWLGRDRLLELVAWRFNDVGADGDRSGRPGRLEGQARGNPAVLGQVRPLLLDIED